MILLCFNSNTINKKKIVKPSLIWIGDQLTQKGICNGTSLLIMAGIIRSMPSTFTSAYNALVANLNY